MTRAGEGRRLAVRRFLKWAGVVVCLLLCVAWGLTVFWLPWWILGQGSVQYAAYLEQGYVGFVRFTQSPRAPTGISVLTRPLQDPLLSLDGLWIRTMSRGAVSGFWVPLWMPLAVVGGIAGLLFWQDRRRVPPGHCGKCGYNLSGNVSGVCPECGTVVEQSEPNP